MRYNLVLFLSLFCMNAFGQDVKAEYILPDSIKTIAFYADILVKNASAKNTYTGIQANGFRLELTKKKRQRTLKLNFDKNAILKVMAPNVTSKRAMYFWSYNWKENEKYSLLFIAAVDSATHRSIYSGYIFLPEENKWKLIATQIFGDTQRITQAWPANEWRIE